MITAKNSTTFTADDLGDTRPKVVIGGSDKSKFIPNINMSFHSDEFYLNMNRKDKTVKSETASLDKGKISQSAGNDTDEYYIDKNDRLKWDVVFSECPKSMTIEWELQHTDGIEFFYQGELTAEDNLESACDNYSATRGLAGTALPAAAADAAGGLPISDAGGLDIDTLLATLTNGTYGLSALETLVDELESRLTAARAGNLDNIATAPPTAAAIADAVLDEVVEGTLTLRQMSRIFNAALAGKLTITDNGTTYTFAFRDVADSKDRISVTVNKTSKNRTAVTVDGA